MRQVVLISRNVNSFCLIEMHNKHSLLHFSNKWLILIGLAQLVFASCSIFSLNQTQQPQTKYPATIGEFPLEEIWSFDASNDIVSGPVIGDGRVVFRTNNTIYGLDLLSGELKWSTPLPAGINASQMMISHGIVFSAYDHGIAAFDISDGRAVWKNDLFTYGSEVKIKAVTSDRIFVNRVSVSVDVLNIKSGELEWQKNIRRGSADVFPENDHVYILEGRKVTSHKITTGAQLWEIDIGLAGVNEFHDGVLYYAPLIDAHRKSLIAIDLQSHGELWKIDLSEEIQSISFLNNKLFVSLESRLASINPEKGSLIWQSERYGNLFQRSVYLDRSIFIVSSFSKEIYAFSETDGDFLGALRMGKPAVLFLGTFEVQSEVAAPDNIIVFSAGTRIIAYGK
jgi:outer membrane protein assembly factor BamB